MCDYQTPRQTLFFSTLVVVADNPHFGLLSRLMQWRFKFLPEVKKLETGHHLPIWRKDFFRLQRNRYLEIQIPACGVNEQERGGPATRLVSIVFVLGIYYVGAAHWHNCRHKAVCLVKTANYYPSGDARSSHKDQDWEIVYIYNIGRGWYQFSFSPI